MTTYSLESNTEDCIVHTIFFSSFKDDYIYSLMPSLMTILQLNSNSKKKNYCHNIITIISYFNINHIYNYDTIKFNHKRVSVISIIVIIVPFTLRSVRQLSYWLEDVCKINHSSFYYQLLTKESQYCLQYFKAFVINPSKGN